MLLVVYLAPLAQSEPVQSGRAVGAGWAITTSPGIVDSNIFTPLAVAEVPTTCPTDGSPCEQQVTNALGAGSALGTVATASAINSEAHASKDPTAGSIVTTVIDPSLAAEWNVRGYGSIANLSALSGRITADLLEAEAVSGTRDNAGTIENAVRGGANIVNLKVFDLLGREMPLLQAPTGPNQDLIDTPLLKVKYFETNWDGAFGTTDGQPLYVNTLRITTVDVAGVSTDIILGHAEAGSVYVAPPPPNVPPDAVDDSRTTDEGTPVTLNVTANDTDSDGTIVNSSVTFTQPTSGTVTCSDNMCTYTPNSGFVGTDTFTYTVCDNDGACDTATVTITVNATGGGTGGGTNTPPNARDDAATTGENDTVVIDVTDNDTDSDGTIDDTTVVATDPAGGTVTCADNLCTYTPDPGFTGTDTFDYTVCDDDGACDTATVTVTVTPTNTGGGGGGGATNNPPNAEDDSATTQQDSPVVVDVAANDTDFDGTLDPTSITYTQPANGTVTCTLNLCTYEPNPGFSGTDSFDYTICDDDGACDTATVTITVTPTNTGGGGGGGGGSQPPDAVDDTQTAQPGESVTIPVTDNDSGNVDPSTVTVIDPPDNGTVDCANNGSCTYTPDDGFTGTDDFTYEVCNGAGQCDQATVVVIVPPTIPDTSPPVAEDDEATTRRGTPIPITVIQNDTDPDGDLDTSSVRIVQQPQNGTVTCVGGICTYTPNPGFTGEDGFVYEICDAEGNCDTATVTVIVRPPDNGGEPGGSIGEGGSSGGGGGNGGGSNGPGDGGPKRPDRDRGPSRPGDGPDAPDATIDPVPLTGLNPVLGAPKNPALPMTGGEPGFYLALALNLVLAGGLLLFLDTRSRRAAAINVPALLGGGVDLTDHEDAETTSPKTEPQPDVVVLEPQPEAEVVAPTAVEKPKKQTTRKPAAAKKPAVKKKTTTAKKPAAKKAATAKTSTAKKATAKKASTKKSTVAKPTTKKASTAKKTTARATSTKKSTVAKKSTTRKSS